MTRHWHRALLTGALMLLAQLAHAQYSWMDEKGTRVYSDRPPPPGTPAARILKGPRAPLPEPVVDMVNGAAPTPQGAKPAKPAAEKKPPTLADQDKAFRERQVKREEDARKAKEADDQKAAKAERCATARQQEMQLTSGMRLSQMDANGERSYMSDEERTRKTEAAKRALQDCR